MADGNDNVATDEAGPFCIGTREFHHIVYPANFAKQLDQVRIRADEIWWRSAARELKRASQSKSGRINKTLCAALAHAIDSGLEGILPRSFAAATGVDVGTHARFSRPRELCAVAYALAVERGYAVDKAYAQRMIDRFGIDRRTWHRWRQTYEKAAEDFLYITVCEMLLPDLPHPWASLAVLVSLGLATEEQQRELHLARGGWIRVSADGQEIWGIGPPDIASP